MLPDRCDVCGQPNHPVLFRIHAIVAGDTGPELQASALVCSATCAMIAISDPLTHFTPATAAIAEEIRQEVLGPDTPA